MNDKKHAWMVRAGNDNELADLVEKENVKSSREVLIGHGAGPYEYHADAYRDHYPHVRLVQWLQLVAAVYKAQVPLCRVWVPAD